MRRSRPAEEAGGLTLHRTLGAGEVVRSGTLSPYRRLVGGPGEAHVVREDLAAAASDAPARRRSLLAFAHVTDLQLADVQSPGRFEYCNRHVEDPRFRHLVPMHRPQEALGARAVQAMVETLNSVPHGPVQGGDVELVLTTGDAVDNAQWNEVRMFLALLEGGRVRPGSGGPRYEGVQSPTWGDDSYWRPDGSPQPGDWYQRRHAFPYLPGLLEQALEEFDSRGLRLPWLACFGNHEVLVQGVGRVTDAVQEALVGGSKATGAPVDLDLETLHEQFIEAPERFLSGHRHPVTADPDRRCVTRQEFVDAHFSALSRPLGHGFTAANRLSGTAYYAYDAGPVRFVCLDTTRRAGASHGCLDEDQLRWLAARLEEVHSHYSATDGATVRTGHDDRLVVVFSHHGLDTMTNLGVLPGAPEEPRLAGGGELRDL